LFSKTYNIDHDLSENETADFNVTQTLKGSKVDCIPDWINSSSVQISGTEHLVMHPVLGKIHQYTSYQFFFNKTCTTKILIEAYGEPLLIEESHINNSTLSCAKNSIKSFAVLISSAIILILVIISYFTHQYCLISGNPVN